MAAANQATKPTAQRLGAILKSARKIMRKDKGLNGDLDRIPMLTWIMFLKFLDDREQIEEDRAALANTRFHPTIESPYRWRDWAAREDGVTGPELISFVNNDEAVRPDGTRGLGLFAYLKSLAGEATTDRRSVVATVFDGVVNRMVNGYLLRDVINKVNEIHFEASEEISLLGTFYENMLREMRDAAGDAGEFYTPRPAVRLMVELTDPRIGEEVLDPACGTGGFLVEAFTHLESQCETVADRTRLQTESVRGGEAKPLPYLLCQMNLLLHGLRAPDIDPGNSLRTPLRDIGPNSRVDVILTNPPFGGEEERGILSNFPADRRTADTALLFLQLIMRRLRRRGESEAGGRAAVVVPDPVLSGDGVCARIKDGLLRNFNLHTIVRLPNGVFSPYTPIPTNILFFDSSAPTETIWYYEHPLPEGYREYTKTRPLRFEEFHDLRSWWHSRSENERAWKVSVGDVLEYDEGGTIQSADLDIRNPNRPRPFEGVEPVELAKEVRVQGESDVSRTCELESHVAELVRDLADLAPGKGEASLPAGWTRIPLSDVLAPVQDRVEVQTDQSYQNFGIYNFGKGTFEKDPISGFETSAKVLYRVRADQFIYSRLFAFEGAYTIVPEEFDGWFVSNEYPTFQCDQSRASPGFLKAYFRNPEVWSSIAVGSKGLGHRRQRVQPQQLLSHKIALPPIPWQLRLVTAQALCERLSATHERRIEKMGVLVPALLSATITP